MKKNSFIGWVLCFTMVFVTVFFGGCSNTDNSVSSRVNQLYAEKKRIGYNVDKCKNELEKLTVTKSGIFFLFEDMDTDLLDVARPALENHNGLVGMVAVKPNEYKNSDVFTELYNSNWEFAIGFSDNYTFPEDDTEAAEALEEYIGLYGKDHPKVISFSSGNAKYRRSFDQTLIKCGINVIIAPKLLLAGGDTYLEYDHETGLLKISSTQFSMRNTVESIMRASINDKHPLTLSINKLEDASLSAVSENISLERFNLMLDFLDNYDNVFYGKTVGYKDYVASQHDANIEKYNEIMGKINEYNLLIKDIEKEISLLVGEEVAA